MMGSWLKNSADKLFGHLYQTTKNKLFLYSLTISTSVVIIQAQINNIAIIKRIRLVFMQNHYV